MRAAITADSTQRSDLAPLPGSFWSRASSVSGSANATTSLN